MNLRMINGFATTQEFHSHLQRLERRYAFKQASMALLTKKKAVLRNQFPIFQPSNY